MNYRDTRSYLNCEKEVFPGTGTYEFPTLSPVDADLGMELIGFNYVLNEKNPERKIVHFYLDDYQFERVWSLPERYIPVLARFGAVLTPDFSMYTDFPVAVQMFNHYRKQWCGAFWQRHGLKVIPTIGWSDERSYDWCFDGIPHNAPVSISTIGGHKDPEVRKLWLKGYYKALEVLQPSEILLVGRKFPEIEFDGKMTVVQSGNLERKERLSTRNGEG